MAKFMPKYGGGWVNLDLVETISYSADNKYLEARTGGNLLATLDADDGDLELLTADFVPVAGYTLWHIEAADYLRVVKTAVLGLYVDRLEGLKKVVDEGGNVLPLSYLGRDDWLPVDSCFLETPSGQIINRLGYSQGNAEQFERWLADKWIAKKGVGDERGE